MLSASIDHSATWGGNVARGQNEMQPDEKTLFHRHVANTLFQALRWGGNWHPVQTGHSSPFSIKGAGQNPKSPYDPTVTHYEWLTCVAPAMPQFDWLPHAVFLDSMIYDEVLFEFKAGTKDAWENLLWSGTRKLYNLDGLRFRSNRAIKSPLPPVIALKLAEELDKRRLIIPIDLTHQELQDSHKGQMLTAMLKTKGN